MFRRRKDERGGEKGGEEERREEKGRGEERRDERKGLTDVRSRLYSSSKTG